MLRLVTADVAFYTGNLRALKGLKDLVLNMAEIWEQKRWWHTGKLGSLTVGCTCLRKYGCLWFKNWAWNPRELGWGREKERTGVGETGFQWDLQGMPILCFLQWRITDQVSIFFILSGNRLRFLWTKSKRTHSCNTAVVD